MYAITGRFVAFCSYFTVDATISFPEGLAIYWNGQEMGTLAMSDVQLGEAKQMCWSGY